MSPIKSNQQTGFTVIELLIATTIFSLVLLLISNGVLQAGRLFHKGVTLTNTQEVVRVIIDDVSQAIQFNGGAVTPIAREGSSDGFCVGERRYSYLTNIQLTDDGTPNPDQENHVLVVDDFSGGCNSQTPAQDLSNPPIKGSRELMGLHMRLTKFNIEPVGDSRRGLYNVNIRVVYGDSDLLDPITNDRCRDIRDGNQFCSASELTTTVQKRIK